jgi:hypothetical protein
MVTREFLNVLKSTQVLIVMLTVIILSMRDAVVQTRARTITMSKITGMSMLTIMITR